MNLSRPLSILFNALVFACAASGCAVQAYSEDGAASSEQALTTTEGFESGSKTAYAAGNVTLSSGSWNMNDALIGNLSTDVKVGSAAARVRNSGTVSMNFDRTGAGIVTVKSATFGSDSSGSWGLYSSTDHGSTWSKLGSTITTTSSLTSASFTVNVSGSVRFSLRKLDGGSNRVDLDEISITDYSGGGGGGSGGGGSGGGSGTGAGVSVHTKLGLPSAASTSNWNDYLSVKSQYVLAYNSSRKIPNWVSWELNSSYIGSQARLDDFRPDDTLPSGMPQASLADYSGSGYDRGHMCPSGDRTASAAANSLTFYLSNMVPQAANNNQGPWEKLESYSRTLAGQGKELFIISGGVGNAGTIGAGVVVPNSTFKVIAVLDQVGQGPANVTTSTRLIGIVIPNNNSQVAKADDWKPYRVSVRSIEALTGLNFLSDVAQSVQDVIEPRVDTL
ncbi:MAG TPA: DNA/RNA non-specific endonuclease [Polyangiaceae bacterium]|nr:DNA/RNA non-specific endonuclease [Polyangiaceae bacterium]